jgi:hypothetical protein
MACEALADPGAIRVHFFLSPANRTVSQLVGSPIAQGGQSTRHVGTESTVYRIQVKLLAAKVEDDSDIHLEVADPATGRTMIGELPAYGCTRGASAENRKRMEQARAAFLKACRDPGSDNFTVYSRQTTATITGVRFFDFNHGQRGVARNAIELHPVTAITIRGCR